MFLQCFFDWKQRENSMNINRGYSMEMQIIIGGVGINFPKTDFGVNLASGVYLNFRLNSGCVPRTFGIMDSVTVGGGNRSFIVGGIKTDWFKVMSDKHPFVKKLSDLKGKIGDVHVIGSLALNGRVKIVFNVIDENGNMTKLVEKFHIPASGMQASETKIQGQMRMMPQATGQCVTK